MRCIPGAYWVWFHLKGIWLILAQGRPLLSCSRTQSKSGGSREMDFRSAPQSQINRSGTAQQNFGEKGLCCLCKRVWPLSYAPAIEGPKGVPNTLLKPWGHQVASGEPPSTHLLPTGLGSPCKARPVLWALSQTAAGPAFSPGLTSG